MSWVIVCVVVWQALGWFRVTSWRRYRRSTRYRAACIRRYHHRLSLCLCVCLSSSSSSSSSDSFKLNSYTITRSHQYKLYKPSCSHNSRATFFSQRVLNVWNALPDSIDFASLNKFKQSILHIDFNEHLVCFKGWLLVIFMCKFCLNSCLLLWTTVSTF